MRFRGQSLFGALIGASSGVMTGLSSVSDGPIH